MAAPRLEVHPDAVEEAAAARIWYAERSAAAAHAFLLELDAAVGNITEAPDRWREHLHGTRRCLMRRFPFSIVYRRKDNGIQIVAFAHAKRKPGCWKGR